MSFRKSFSFQGRISRSTFWLMMASVFLAQLILIMGIVLPLLMTGRPELRSLNDSQAVTPRDLLAPPQMRVAVVLASILGQWILLAASAKRWRDLGQSGWLALITLVFPPLLLYLGFKPGSPESR
jgi:uncharacterized membrane protein YhaH (DUF805 family)